jgi:hypothetical protein
MIVNLLTVVHDENGTAIFSETKPITYAEVVAEQQDASDYDAKEYQTQEEIQNIQVLADQLRLYLVITVLMHGKQI